MKKPFLFFTLIISFFVVISAQATDFHKGYKEAGTASYYGKKFHGRLTANGEKFNMHALTAAHKTLPFNTLVKVTDVTTGKYIMVRINDRGPFVKGRTIDLSKGAARELGMLRKGVAKVEIELVRLGTGEDEDEEIVEVKPPVKKEKKEPTKKEVKGTTYSIWGKEKAASGSGIQIGAFTSQRQMIAESKKAYSRDLKDLYVQKVIINKKLHYRLLFLATEDKDVLQKALRRAKKMGYRGAFIRKHL